MSYHSQEYPHRHGKTAASTGSHGFSQSIEYNYICGALEEELRILVSDEQSDPTILVGLKIRGMNRK